MLSAWWNWSGVAWHWVLYVLAAVVLAVLAGAWFYYRDPPDEAAAFEAELDAVDPTVSYVGGAIALGMEGGAATDPQRSTDRSLRVGTHLPPAHLEARHEHAWYDDPYLTVWDAQAAALRCWEILHVDFPRLRAELGIAA